MLAVSGRLPASEEDSAYAYEMKWDGIRALLSFRAGRIRISTRTLHDVTSSFPEILPIITELKRRGISSCVLDGEIVSLTSAGIPSFQQLQTRLGVTARPLNIAKSYDHPVTLMIFDIIALNNKNLRSLPYRKRRSLLDALHLNGPSWRTPPMHIGNGATILQIAKRKHLEGIIAKKVSSPYLGGVRSPAWKKIKLHAGQELVIGGFTKGRGSRSGRIGALLVGYYGPRRPPTNGSSVLHYAGRVGTGFMEESMSSLLHQLRPLVTSTNPFSSSPFDHISHGKKLRKSDVVFVRPRLVGQFRFTEWTKTNALRHPSFLGLRSDKKPHEVIREEA